MGLLDPIYLYIYIYIGKYCQLLVVGTIYNDLEKFNEVHEKHVVMDFAIFKNKK